MDFREILKLQFDEYQSETERLIDGLSDEERRFMPSKESHHIDFALWHASRAEDILLNLGGQKNLVFLQQMLGLATMLSK